MGPHSIYCDGGVIKKNPSPIGGTWAWIATDCQEQEIDQNSGIITPAEAGLEAITNNYTELLAAAEALQSVPFGWDGTLYTDSYVTQCRLDNIKPSFAGIPDNLRKLVDELKAKLGPIRVVLLDGHPTAA